MYFKGEISEWLFLEQSFKFKLIKCKKMSYVLQIKKMDAFIKNVLFG